MTPPPLPTHTTPTNIMTQADQAELLPLLIDLGVLSRDVEGADTEADELLAEMEMLEMDANGDGKVSFEEVRPRGERGTLPSQLASSIFTARCFPPHPP